MTTLHHMQKPIRSLSRRLMVIPLVGAIALAGCSNMTEEQKTTTQGAAIGAGVGALGGYVWSNKMQEQKKQMEAATAGTGIGVSQTADNRLKLDVPADAGFSSGSSTLSPTMVRVLGQFATTLQQNQATQVAIIGHTDSSGSDAINNPLSFDRANATRDYLVGRGVAATRISTDGKTAVFHMAVSGKAGATRPTKSHTGA